jgi:hypothetical protein
MKYAIIGSRGYTDRWKIANWIKNNLYSTDTVISGGARGPDTVGATLAKKLGATIITHKPNYDKYGTRAPLVRNILIVKDCDMVIAFWDGESTGTLNAIKHAVTYKKEVLIIP